MRICFGFLFIILVLTFNACQEAEDFGNNEKVGFNIDFEKFTLDNGLQVILHVDRSDPVVAVALTAHVGSARESKGKTGFAHLFEHLLFLESENLGKGGLDKMSAKIGGSGANGSTSRDRTNYFQTVPKDALEKMIWAEADKLGYFINTVTEPVLAKEKQVVKNEKRQAVDNRPYGHVSYVIGKHLYPENHPYNWQVIGSLEDLQNANLDDVKSFFNRWYTPNNVTLTIAGDIDVAQTKVWVHKYFDEIKRGEEVEDIAKQPVALDRTKHLYYEDNFARLPQLTMTFPTVYQYHPDAYPLEVLASYLSEGKTAPLNQILVDQLQLSSNVSMYNYNSELAGELHLRIRAFEKTPLDQVMKGIETAFKDFEKTGISQADLERIKAVKETAFYTGLSSVLGKGFQLAQYEIFAGDPGYINEDVQNILAVTAMDVQRVYRKYIKDKPFVSTSFVPRGEVELILTGAEQADVIEEVIIDGAEETFNSNAQAEYQKTVSSFDRSMEPTYGEAPVMQVPKVWKERFSTGMELYGITNDEVPLVQLKLTIKGGLLLEKSNEKGISNLLAKMLLKGTEKKSTAELEIAAQKLGASLRSYSTNEAIIFEVTTLARNFQKTMDLIAELILHPRWCDTELSLLKRSIISRIQQESVNPNSIAANEFEKLVYGEGHLLAHNILGTEESIKGIYMEDLKAFYEKNIAPNISILQIVGDITRREVISSMDQFENHWSPKEVDFPAVDAPKGPEKSVVYFYNVPDAKQTALKFGNLAISAKNEDFYPVQIMNFRLGGGGFASDLTQVLRESKGYTYNIRSEFAGTEIPGTFSISSNVRSNVTYHSSRLIKRIMRKYGRRFSAEDLEITKSSMIKSNARAFETLNAKLNMLSNISNYGYSDDYINEREEIVKNITIDDIKDLAEKYINPDKMIYLLVGDAKTQMNKLEKLGFGKPILLNEVIN
ncbi:M16 family metallopeptidase [Portibacter lacus]|uniref:Peptidase M16 n=1 Tax=Portibacter lacus TaxID=1099794 RepID=A0AA37SUR9_9BACT|nr:pitrilysin family protein [Portibacter lacus]GLR20139.1 peptidase M16 [Portibacter lacus]